MLGFLNVYKPAGMSSAAVVGKIKKHFNIKKVGHMGTLDPLACGVLPIAVGKATRMFDYFLNKQKTYVVEAEFGYETPSLDLGTEVHKTTNVVPNLEQIVNNCTMFVGEISQIPPIYSAKSVNGERAYDLARKGEEIELKPVTVQIFKFECLGGNDKRFKFIITCSSGTYVRSLIRDLAKSLNSLATVTMLERVDSGYFKKESSANLDDLLSLNSLDEKLVSVTDVFDYKIVEITNEEFNLLRNGVAINTKHNFAENFFVVNNKNVIGVGKIELGKIKLKTFLLED